MNKIGVLVASILLAIAIPAQALNLDLFEQKDIRAANAEYIIGLAGDAYDPTDMDADADLQLALDRLDKHNVDLTLTTGAIVGDGAGTGAAAGDLFLISIHGDGCPSAPIMENPAFPDAGYAWLGTGTTGGAVVAVIDQNGISPSAVFGKTSWSGSSDYYCLNFFGITLDLPYVLGAATAGV